MVSDRTTDPMRSIRYVPADYTGPTGRCGICGNKAPARKRFGLIQCTPCFLGEVTLQLVSVGEARELRRELLDYMREARGPVRRGS